MKKRIARYLRKLGIRPGFHTDLQKNSKSFSKHTTNYKCKVIGGREYYFHGHLTTQDLAHKRGALLIVTFKNTKKKEAQKTGLRYAEHLGSFEYLNVTKKGNYFKVSFTVPAHCREINVEIRSFSGVEAFHLKAFYLKHVNKNYALKESKPKVKILPKPHTQHLFDIQDRLVKNSKVAQKSISQKLGSHSSIKLKTKNCLALSLDQARGDLSPQYKVFVEFQDERGILIPSPYENLKDSPLGSYVDSNQLALLIPPRGAKSVELSLKDTFDDDESPAEHDEVFCDVTLKRVANVAELNHKSVASIFTFQGHKNTNPQSLEKLSDILFAVGHCTGNERYVVKAVRLQFQRCGLTKTLIEKYPWLTEQEYLSFANKQLILHIESLGKSIESLVPSLPPAMNTPNYQTTEQHLLYCLNNSLPYNGSGYSSRSQSIAKNLGINGLNVTCLTRMGYPWERKADAAKMDPGAYRDMRNIDGVKYVALKGTPAQNCSLNIYFQQAADQVYREAQKEGITVIHAASNYLTGIPALIAARYAGVPFIYEVRGLWHLTEQAQINDKLERHKIMEEAEVYLANNADKLLVQTNQLVDWFSERGVDKEKITVIPNGIDRESFYLRDKNSELYEKYELNPDLTTIGYAGSIVQYEGLDLLVRSVENITKKGMPVQCFIAGSGDQAKVLENLIERHKLTNVNMLGVVPKKEVSDLLNLADIVVIPRLKSEVTSIVAPLKPLEGLALGKKVVAADLPPIRDQLSDEGFYFEPGDVADLTRALEDAIGSDKEINAEVPNNYRWRTSAKTIQLLVNDLYSSINQAEETETLNFAIVSDEFTRKSFEGRHNMLVLDPDNWRQQLEETKVDFFLCESAWEGQDEKWKRKVGYYSEEEFSTMKELLEYCEAEQIPSVFWNKEDPVHFNRFWKTAAHFKYVFTTDANCIPKYLRLTPSKIEYVRSLPFFANPLFHKYDDRERNEVNVCYAGTYYGDRYKERTKKLDVILDASKDYLTIFNRQSGDPDSPYQFPDHLTECVKSKIDYETLVSKYPEFSIHLNGNSVIDSPTMISRRVFEISAVGSFTFSTPSLALSEMLGSLVPSFPNIESAKDLLDTFAADPEYLKYCTNKLTRFILSKHVLEYRIIDILRTLGKPAAPQHGVVPEEVVYDKKSLGFAGHDFKFAQKHLATLAEDGFTVVKDHWNGHNIHDRNYSCFVINNTNQLFCEWTLGNAVFYSKQKKAHQRLVTRLHAQELRTSYLKALETDNIEKILVVAPHMQRGLQGILPTLSDDKIEVVPNFVDYKAYTCEKRENHRFALGFVGFIPQTKRIDKALDILEGLQKIDSRFHLRIKGKTLEDYPWMLKRKNEMEYYNHQFDRIKRDLNGAVSFDGYGADMADWYKNVGFVLSTSENESFHLTITDGAASGAFPVSLDWEGASELYPESWVFSSIDDAVARIAELSQLSDEDWDKLRHELWAQIEPKFNEEQSLGRFLEEVGTV